MKILQTVLFATLRSVTILSPQNNAVLALTCQSNADCAGGYCAGGECKAHGFCGTPLDCVNPSNLLGDELACAVHNWDCPQDSGKCECVPRFSCLTVVSCMTPACQTTPCDESVSCISVDCGGCSAIHFDSAGNHVCTNATSDADEDPGSTIVGNLCVNDSDCVESVSSATRSGEIPKDKPYYCSQARTCLMDGSCGVDSDCTNPANVYEVDACEGKITCQDGDCGIACCQGSECDDSQGNDAETSSDDASSSSSLSVGLLHGQIGSLLWLAATIVALLA